jgi:hypothetical protein
MVHRFIKAYITAPNNETKKHAVKNIIKELLVVKNSTKRRAIPTIIGVSIIRNVRFKFSFKSEKLII